MDEKLGKIEEEMVRDFRRVAKESAERPTTSAGAPPVLSLDTSGLADRVADSCVRMCCTSL